MNHHSMVMARSRTSAQGVWALLAVLWLNMAVSPCAMAFESADHDCPHCPPADEHTMAGHHNHGQREEPRQAEAPCASMQPQCCDAVDATVDSRGSGFSPKDSGDLEFIAVPAPATPVVWPNAHETVAMRPPDPPDSFPSRHILFCVYLD